MTRDEIAVPEESRGFATALERAGHDVRLVELPTDHAGVVGRVQAATASPTM